MAHQVTIEGTTTPSVDLPRGHRRTVVLDDTVRNQVRYGFVKIVEHHDVPDDAPSEEPARVAVPEKTEDTSTVETKDTPAGAPKSKGRRGGDTQESSA